MPSTPEWLTDEQRRQLSECQQGDVVRSLRHQVWIAHGDLPTTERARKEAPRGQLSGVYETAPHGLAILTQTCDLVPRRLLIYSGWVLAFWVVAWDDVGHAGN